MVPVKMNSDLIPAIPVSVIDDARKGHNCFCALRITLHTDVSQPASRPLHSIVWHLLSLGWRH